MHDAKCCLFINFFFTFLFFVTTKKVTILYISFVISFLIIIEGMLILSISLCTKNIYTEKHKTADNISNNEQKNIFVLFLHIFRVVQVAQYFSEVEERLS